MAKLLLEDLILFFLNVWWDMIFLMLKSEIKVLYCRSLKEIQENAFLNI